MATITSELTLYRALRAAVKQWSKRPAVSANGQTLTFAEVGANVDRLAGGLRHLGVGQGDKVAIILPNCPEYISVFFAPSALGATIVPLSPLLRQKEIQHILADSEASVVITEPRPMGNNLQSILEAARSALPNLKHIIMRESTEGYQSLADVMLNHAAPLNADQISSESLAALIYTSGTTGLPKAVMHNHHTLLVSPQRPITGWYKLQVVIKLARQYGWRIIRWGAGQIAVLSPAPFHALLGFASILSLLQGSRVVIAERFQPARILELIERERVTALLAAPTMLTALLNSDEFSKRDHTSLIAILATAAPVPPDLVRRARAAFGCPVVISFGATELGAGGFSTDPFDTDDKQVGTIGQTFPGMEARIVDDQHHEVPRGQVGELAVRHQGHMLGYYHAPELTAQTLDQDNWYYTGDLATMDNKGYIRIAGRKKDMIIRGGQNVFPAEIEKHLLARPEIENIGVVGVPNELAGEHIWAFVLPKAGVTLTPTGVLSFMRGEVAPYKIPDQVRIVDQLPLTPTGKVQKFVLREWALRELSASQSPIQ